MRLYPIFIYVADSAGSLDTEPPSQILLQRCTSCNWIGGLLTWALVKESKPFTNLFSPMLSWVFINRKKGLLKTTIQEDLIQILISRNPLYIANICYQEDLIQIFIYHIMFIGSFTSHQPFTMLTQVLSGRPTIMISLISNYASNRLIMVN